MKKGQTDLPNSFLLLLVRHLLLLGWHLFLASGSTWTRKVAGLHHGGFGRLKRASQVTTLAVGSWYLEPKQVKHLCFQPCVCGAGSVHHWTELGF